MWVIIDNWQVVIIKFREWFLHYISEKLTNTTYYYHYNFSSFSCCWDDFLNNKQKLKFHEFKLIFKLISKVIKYGQQFCFNTTVLKGKSEVFFLAILNLYTQTSVWKFSILFSIHFQCYLWYPPLSPPIEFAPTLYHVHPHTFRVRPHLVESDPWLSDI